MSEITLNGKKVGPISPVFLIAEAGVNHNGEISIAKSLIDIAVDIGVDAIKFQTFITEELITKTVPKVEYQKNSEDDDENFYEMVKKYELSKRDFEEIKSYCLKKGIIFLSTPFDLISIELLENLNIPAYKIGSGDLNNFFLLEKVCSKKKPILISTGMATLTEVKDSVNFIQNRGIKDIILFQCTTNYPCPYEDINLNVIDTFRKEFPNLIIGFSDHSIGIEASIGAVAKGVKVIEKHFTLDKKMDGPDHKASMDPNEMKVWVNSIRKIEKALGSFEKFPSKSEIKIAEVARKSIVSAKKLKRGDIIKPDDIKIKRPGIGIPPKQYHLIIGRKIKRDLLEDIVITWEDIE